ncbi:polysaccharide deacetylase family protein [Paenibacillus sp. S-38]|uniref:polysaccharide deacetylase family protein n=1 Tax=Paenibacillus sp. S-38 TaxID=3416710 RepID=UPI003CF3C3B9
MKLAGMKRAVKEWGTRLFYYSGAYHIINRLLGRGGLYIVGYHRLSENLPDDQVHVLAVTRQNFEDHLRFYGKYFELISMDEVEPLLRQGKLIKDYMAVTFDDGYRDNYTLGHDLFRKYDIVPTIYLTAGPIDRRHVLWTDVIDAIVASFHGPEIQLKLVDLSGTFPLSTPAERTLLCEAIKNEIKRYDEQYKRAAIEELIRLFDAKLTLDDSLIIDWSEVQELAESGVIMGSHTVNHPTLSKIVHEDAVQEVTESRRLIEERLGRTVKHFAYPYGKREDYTPALKESLSQLYTTSVTAISGVNRPGQDLHELKRVIVENISVHQLRVRLLKQKISSPLKTS